MNIVKSTVNKREKMNITHNDIDIQLFKSIDENDYGQSIYIAKNGLTILIPQPFFIDWDDDKDGGRIKIEFLDRWGSKMTFIHYNPSDLIGLFQFLLNGYNVGINLNEA